MKGEGATMTPNPTHPEFSRTVHAAELSDAETVMDFAARPEELAALAKRLDVVGLDAFEGTAALKRLPNGDVRLDARYKAVIRQSCVVTLAPLTNEISAEFTMTYSDSADDDWGHDEEVFEDLDAHIEPSEPLVEGKIDVGEACVEHLSLEIDPFPRVKGATFDGFTAGSGDENAPVPGKSNPFAVLSQLKAKQENKD